MGCPSRNCQSVTKNCTLSNLIRTTKFSESHTYFSPVIFLALFKISIVLHCIKYRNFITLKDSVFVKSAVNILLQVCFGNCKINLMQQTGRATLFRRKTMISLETYQNISFTKRPQLNGMFDLKFCIVSTKMATV